MFCSRTFNNSLNHIDEQALRLVHDNYSSPLSYIFNMLNKKLYSQTISKISQMKFHMHSDIEKTFNPLSANLTKWSNTLKQFVGNFPTNCLSVFDHFVRLALRVNLELKLLLKRTTDVESYSGKYKKYVIF